MNAVAAIITAVEFGDSDAEEAARIARKLLPECWDVTLLGGDMIRLQHGHKGECASENAVFDQAINWQTVLYQLVLLAGPQEVIEARAQVSGMQNPHAGCALQA
jgi:hypothetical protein